MNARSNRRQYSTMSDQEDLVNAEAEAELNQLRQRYRIVENDRRAYFDESNEILRKQRKFIEALQEEKAGYKRDIRKVESKANRIRVDNDFQMMTQLLEIYDEGDRQIDEETHKLQLVNKKLNDLKESNTSQLRIQEGWYVNQERRISTRRKIRLLEGKLAKGTMEFSKALGKNKELREKIRNFRRDIGIFSKSCKEVLKQQGDVKNEMNEILQMSTAASESREECLARMSTIRERNDKDEMAYNNEIKDLTRLLAHEQRLKDFMNTKTQDRSHLLKAAAERTKEKIAKSSKTCLHQEEIKSYEAVFERLMLYAGEANLDCLVHDFLKQEGISFALFNYKSELDSDVEEYTLRNQTLRRDMKLFMDQGVQLEGKRLNIMKDLEVKVADTTLAADTAQNRYKVYRKELDNIFYRIVAFVRKLGCDSSMVTNRLGCGGSINDRNAMSFLGLVEFVSNEVRLVEAFHQHLKQMKKTNSSKKLVAAQQGSVITTKLRPKSPVAVSIVPPSIGDEGKLSSDMERISQPLSPDEIMAKIVRTIEKREVKGRNSSKNDWRWQVKSADQDSPDIINTPDDLRDEHHSGSVELLINPSNSSERGFSSTKQE